MVACNLLPAHSFEEWKGFWQYVGGGEDVVFAKDTSRRALTAFKIRALGTTIIINRQGQVVYRDSGATPYETLRSEVDKAL